MVNEQRLFLLIFQREFNTGVPLLQKCSMKDIMIIYCHYLYCVLNLVLVFYAGPSKSGVKGTPQILAVIGAKPVSLFLLLSTPQIFIASTVTGTYLLSMLAVIEFSRMSQMSSNLPNKKYVYIPI